MKNRIGQFLALLLANTFLAFLLSASTAIAAPNQQLITTIECGNEGESPCQSQLGSTFCDNGLKKQNSICVNDKRRQSVAEDFQETWTYWALNQQRTVLAWEEPLDQVMFIGSHNAFNNQADGYGFPNQDYSITDVLRAGIRVIALDIHCCNILSTGLNDFPVLCHSPNQTVWCSAADRPYYQAIKEIRNWMLEPENQDEVVIITIEDYVGYDDGTWEGNGPFFPNDYVTDPLELYFADESTIGLFTPEDWTDYGNAFPSQQWLVANQKRVLVFAQNSSYEDIWDNNITLIFGQYQFTGSQWMDKNVSSEIDDFTPYPDCTITPDNSPTSPDGSGFADVYGDNHTGGAAEMAPKDMSELAKCNITWASYDGVLHGDDESGLVMAGAVWSWQVGDYGQNGDAALALPLPAAARWQSADPAEEHRFACVKADGSWEITQATGPWLEGWRTCEQEFPNTQFGVPRSGYANHKLLERRVQLYSIWLNFNDIHSEGSWVVNSRPTALFEVHVSEVVEGQPIEFTSGAVDPDDEILIHHWDYGDGITENSLTGGSHSYFYAQDGVYQVTLIVEDQTGVMSAPATIEVTINNAAPVLIPAELPSYQEGQPIYLPALNFSDAGTLDTHTAVFNWTGNITETAAVQETPFGPPGSAEGMTGLVLFPNPFTIGDDGANPIHFCVRDDNDEGCLDLPLTITNVGPSIELSEDGILSFDEGMAFLRRRDEPANFNAEGFDLGSDDLIFNWSVSPVSGGNAVVSASNPHYNDGLQPDPQNSPEGIRPFAASDTFTDTLTTPGLFTLRIDLSDDDGGTSYTSALTLITDSRSCSDGEAFWRQQFAGQGQIEIETGRLIAYLEIIRFTSQLYNESTLSGLATALNILQQGGGPSQQLQQQILAAWLNFAAGGLDWNTDVEGQPFHERMVAAETLLQSAASPNVYNQMTQTLREMNRRAPGASCNNPGPALAGAVSAAGEARLPIITGAAILVFLIIAFAVERSGILSKLNRKNTP